MPTVRKLLDKRKKKTVKNIKTQCGGLRFRTTKKKPLKIGSPNPLSFKHTNSSGVFKIPLYTHMPIIRAQFQEKRNQEISKQIKNLFNGKKQKQKINQRYLLNKYTRPNDLVNSSLLATRKHPEIYRRASPNELQSVFGKNYNQVLDAFEKQYTLKGLNTTLEGQQKFAELMSQTQRIQNTSTV